MCPERTEDLREMRRVAVAYRRASLAVVGLSLLVGCSVVGPANPIREEDYRETIRVACVGDSITYGARIHFRYHNAYPAQLGQLLGEKWNVRNFGVTRATLLKKGDRPYWEEPAFTSAQELQPHVVIIMLGTNDTKPQNWVHAREFVADYVELIRTFAELESRPRIWICYPVPAFSARSGIRDSVINPEVLSKIDQVAARTGCPIIDLYRPLSNKPRLFSDRVHPNAAGAREIATTIYTALTGRTSAARPTRRPGPLAQLGVR
jgi:lysophospholipase L1-like esterase